MLKILLEIHLGSRALAHCVLGLDLVEDLLDMAGERLHLRVELRGEDLEAVHQGTPFIALQLFVDLSLGTRREERAAQVGVHGVVHGRLRLHRVLHHD